MHRGYHIVVLHHLPHYLQREAQDQSVKGIRNIMHSWINAIMACSGVFKRLDSGEGSYLKEVCVVEWIDASCFPHP